MKKVIIGASSIHRRGMIAAEDIPKGSFILFVKGKRHYLRVSTKKQSLSHPDWIGISRYTWIDPQVPCKYLNHSCEPSAGMRGRIGIYALKDIRKGDEITVDYSTIEPDSLWEMKCTCGAKRCRKIIRSVHFLPYTTYRRYLPYIPTYFQKAYADKKTNIRDHVHTN